MSSYFLSKWQEFLVVRSIILYRVIINYCPIAVSVENPHKFCMCRSLTTLDKLIDRFPLPSGAPPIGDTSLSHVMRLAAHSTTSLTPTAMVQSFIMALYIVCNM
jgi:hypothetical protein